MTNLPRLELTEDPNKKNDFIIFRHQIKGKKMPKGSTGSASFSKKVQLSSKKTRKYRKTKTRKHKKRKSIFNIF
jgi:hypothetical protein